MIERIDMKDHKTWKEKRGKRIGGSDIACVVGLNPWKTNVQLWREKMGIEKPDDISGKPAVIYGLNAEPLIRDIFKLSHEELRVDYVPDNLWLNDKYPFAHASLDGWLEDNDRNMGVLEIKTGSIRNSKSLKDWNGRIPDHYYCQVLWYMMVTDSDYAWLTAMLTNWNNEKIIREYEIRRDEVVEQDIQMLAEEGEKFWKSMQAGIEPPLKLPNL